MAGQKTAKTSAPKITDRIRSVWGRLTDEEVGYYETDHQKFCDAVKQKYGLPQDEIDKQIKLLEREPRVAA